MKVSVGSGGYVYVLFLIARFYLLISLLWQCFKTDDQLIVAYSMTPAFG
jgi:hypothetical protein